MFASLKKSGNTVILTKGNLHNAPPTKYSGKEISSTPNSTKSSKLDI